MKVLDSPPSLPFLPHKTPKVKRYITISFGSLIGMLEAVYCKFSSMKKNNKASQCKLCFNLKKMETHSHNFTTQELYLYTLGGKRSVLILFFYKWKHKGCHNNQLHAPRLISTTIFIFLTMNLGIKFWQKVEATKFCQRSWTKDPYLIWDLCFIHLQIQKLNYVEFNLSY